MRTRHLAAALVLTLALTAAPLAPAFAAEPARPAVEYRVSGRVLSIRLPKGVPTITIEERG